MANTTRRDFLRASAAATALSGLSTPLGALLAQAQAVPANHATGSIKDVEHVVILMLENRSFDHYFGTMRLRAANRSGSKVTVHATSHRFISILHG